MPEQTLLCGWGRTAPTRAAVVTPEEAADVQRALSNANGRGTLARGLGRSYGDAAQCAGGVVLDMRSLARIGELDPTTGEVEVGAGASLDSLVRATLPSGWFLPVTPGTRQVTVGGAIAADVHGKNHHVDGSFAQHVAEMTVVTPTGPQRVSPTTDAELFWGTAGGMGLTGVVTEARVQMLRVETDQMLVDTDRFADLDGVMAAMERGDADYRYSVAWVDCTAALGARAAHGRAGRSRRTGRAVLTRARHAARDDLAPADRQRTPSPPPAPWLSAPRRVPSHLLNALSIAAFNEAWYRKAPRHRTTELQSMWRFFHPLDGVAGWNHLYGPRGFLQYQFVVGPDEGAVVAAVIRELADRRIPSFLAVLKRFGPSAPGPLSFPAPGWTLALDMPIGPPALRECLDRLDETVAAAGGRVYLAKDSRLRPDLLATMYPRIGELRALRRRLDPDGVMRSDLSRRLGLDRMLDRVPDRVLD